MIDVWVNGQQRKVPREATVEDVVRLVTGADCLDGIAVARAEEVVPAGAWSRTCVTTGDRLEILGAVAGG
ncbi:sulfur carrier protein ThiS [Kineosporia sp. J2-2]|uniref:Sulfur carrier protein ThiS n=1 Tax=Kineosporia corallincola TaxID=2835133 RepID=A0ABS5TBH1_9ACTN|nr:sulfur carrier protein ThiS [Kineosporia corallincola]MBT0768423.1 sulfur carrier protein ThiS [Kineosporia corallincola]